MIKLEQVTRIPLCKYITEFKSCTLCYEHSNCCTDPFLCEEDHTVLVVSSDFEDWDKLETTVSSIRARGKFIRLIVEKDIPDSILWAISYDHRNVLQINVNIQNPLDQLTWTTNLAHASERCGLFFVFLIYPILPGVTQTYHVLSMMDTIRSIPYCLVMLKFALFNNDGKLSTDTYLNVNSKVVSKEFIQEIRPGVWNCTESFKKDFFHKIQIYARFQRMSVEVCGGLS